MPIQTIAQIYSHEKSGFIAISRFGNSHREATNPSDEKSDNYWDDINIARGNFYTNTFLNQFYAKHWIIANQGTPDYYLVDSHNNVLLYDCQLRVKNDNFFYNRNLNFKIGDRFVGIYPNSFSGCIEDITGKLLSPLASNKLYKISLNFKSYRNVIY